MANVVGGLTGGISGAATGAKLGTMVGGPVGTVIGGVAGGLLGLFSGGKESKAPAVEKVDIAKVMSDARTAASDNLKNSIALEQQFMPETSALRTTNNAGLNALFRNDTAGFQARDNLLGSLNSPIANSGVSTNPLLQAASESIMGQLKLGGTLGKDVQAQAMQAALEKGGAAGISGSGAGRGLVARDLGLTSLGLLQQRQQAAQSAGATQASLALQGENLKLNDYLGRLSAASGAANQDLNKQHILSSIIESRGLPESGLSPSAIANMYVGNVSATNQYNANQAQINAYQNNQQLNQLLGLGSVVTSAGGSKALASLIGGIKGGGGTGGGSFSLNEDEELGTL